jgi:RimJ/RimL family protein N-acetyltransferase
MILPLIFGPDRIIKGISFFIIEQNFYNFRKKIMEISVRKWKPGDEEELASQANNIKIYNNVRDLFPNPYTLKEAEKWIKYNSGIAPPENMAIIVDGKVAGGIGIKRMEDVYRKTMEIGYFLGESYWGKGIMTHVVRQYVDYMFRTFDINRIIAPVFDFNIGSQRVLEKVGFRKEAVMIKSVIKNNVFRNEIIYALLREEFQF